MLREGTLPPMHPYITSSQIALDVLSVNKACVEGKKKDRELLRAGQLARVRARESARWQGTDRLVCGEGFRRGRGVQRFVCREE